METRVCGRCAIEKPIDEFGFRYAKLGIRHSWCKDCFVDYKRVWYSQNRERHLALVKSSTAVTLAENQLRLGCLPIPFYAVAPSTGVAATEAGCSRSSSMRPSARRSGSCRTKVPAEASGRTMRRKPYL